MQGRKKRRDTTPTKEDYARAKARKLIEIYEEQERFKRNNDINYYLN